MKETASFPLCGVPVVPSDTILLAHGGGGSLMHHLIVKVFQSHFKDLSLESQHDAALINVEASLVAFTTDSYVVHPRFFPGGDIGKLAVCGTMNDLAMVGAEPYALSAAFLIEEGFSIQELDHIVGSMANEMRTSGVRLMTGDTKVVERGKCDGLFINTSGIGFLKAQKRIHPKEIEPEDVVIVSGDLGRHGIAVMSARQGLSFESVVQSDCGCLWPSVKALIEAKVEVHCLRDLTRGGLASALCEIACTRGIAIELEEQTIPVMDPVAAACEMLGLDPMYVANEGRFVLFVSNRDAMRALHILQQKEISIGSKVIGKVVGQGKPEVILRTALGISRRVEMLSGEQLPRIC